MPRIIGVDGGLAHMGIAVLDYGGAGPPSHEDIGKFPGLRYLEGSVHETLPQAKKRGIRKSDDNMERARTQAKRLLAVVERCGPNLLVYEAQSFGMKGKIAGRQAATAFGIIAGIAEAKGLPMLCVTPQDIKRAVAYPKATKEEVIEAVDAAFPLITWPTHKGWNEHLADAVGAVCACLYDSLVLALLNVENAGRVMRVVAGKAGIAMP